MKGASWRCGFSLVSNADVQPCDALFSWTDEIMDTRQGENGPDLGLFGWPYWLYRKTRCENTWTHYGELERYANPSGALVDVMKYKHSLAGLHAKLDRNLFEETYCIIHFQLMLLNEADARLARETMLCPKIMRENRFKLMSNGIRPPSDFFQNRFLCPNRHSSCGHRTKSLSPPQSHLY